VDIIDNQKFTKAMVINNVFQVLRWNCISYH